MAAGIVVGAGYGLHKTGNAPLWISRLYSHSLENACEDRILNTLTTPDTYNRVSTLVDKKEATVDIYIAFRNSLYPNLDYTLDAATAQVIAQSGLPVEWSVLVAYDTHNGDGILERFSAFCRSVKIGGDADFDLSGILHNEISYNQHIVRKLTQ